MDIDKRILTIVQNELGQKSAQLFYEFYHGFPQAEQLDGAKDLLKETIGASRTNALMKGYLKSKEQE